VDQPDIIDASQLQDEPLGRLQMPEPLAEAGGKKDHRGQDDSPVLQDPVGAEPSDSVRFPPDFPIHRYSLSFLTG
jgi:hypothetical protein